MNKNYLNCLMTLLTRVYAWSWDHFPRLYLYWLLCTEYVYRHLSQKLIEITWLLSRSIDSERHFIDTLFDLLPDKLIQSFNFLIGSLNYLEIIFFIGLKIFYWIAENKTCILQKVVRIWVSKYRNTFLISLASGCYS